MQAIGKKLSRLIFGNGYISISVIDRFEDRLQTYHAQVMDILADVKVADKVMSLSIPICWAIQ
jgi:hypothetical protein